MARVQEQFVHQSDAAALREDDRAKGRGRSKVKIKELFHFRVYNILTCLRLNRSSILLRGRTQSGDVPFAAQGAVRNLSFHFVFVSEAIVQLHRLLLTLHQQRRHIDRNDISKFRKATWTRLIERVATVLEHYSAVTLAGIWVAYWNGSATGEN